MTCVTFQNVRILIAEIVPNMISTGIQLVMLVVIVDAGRGLNDNKGLSNSAAEYGWHCHSGNAAFGGK